MLQNIRDNTQGTIAKVIIALISIPFVLFGVESLFTSGGSKNKVAEVNGESVSVQELNEAVYLRKKQLISQMGDKIDPAMLDDNRLKGPALDSLIERKVLLQAAASNDMVVADAQLNKIILETPEFQEDGRFSKTRFSQVLASANLTPEIFKRLYKTDLLLNQYSSGLVNTGFVTDAEVLVDARFTHQTRDIRFIKLELEKAKQAIDADDAAVQAYYDAHPEQFQSEESVVAQFVELKLADFMKEVSAEEVKAAYDDEVANFTAKETREVAHILIELDEDTDKAKATETLTSVKQKLADGANFAEMAKQFSDDLGSKEFGGELGPLNADAFPQAFVAAAQSLNEGQVSDIVETESGLHLIKLTRFETTQPKTFDERKESLIAELKLAKAEPDFWAAVEELKDISFNAVDLEEPAAALNLDVQISAPVTRKGGEGVFANPSVVAALFSETVLKDKTNSDVIEVGKDHVVVVHAQTHNPVALLPFETVKDKAKTAYVTEQATQQLADQAAEIEQELQQGGDVEALAKANRYNWELMLAAKRTSAKADRSILKTAFALPAPSAEQRAIDKVQLGNGDYAVLVVSNVVDGQQKDLNEVESNAMQNYISRSRAMEQFQALQQALKDQAEIERL